MDINQLVTDVGSGATAGASDVMAGPIGTLIYFTVGLTLISFAVGMILHFLPKKG
jgi:hypothetical protein